jgi:hypothetical protein
MTQALTVYRRSELEAVAAGCLHRYKALWRDGANDVTDLSLIGIGGHAVQHAYIVRLVDRQIPSDAEEAQHAFVEGIANAQTPARLIPEVRKIWDFHVPHFELPLEQFIAAEEHQDSGNVGFTPDLVLGHPERNELEIIDFKWGWAPPLTEEEVRGLFQARVYSRYAMDRWKGFSSYRFTLNAVRFGKYVSVVFSRADLDQVDVEIAASVATIHQAERTGEWPAIPGPACHFCELQCPIEDPGTLIPKRVLGAEAAKALGQLLLVNKQRNAAWQKVLKGYVTTHGGVDCGGMVWDNREVTERKYPISEVLRVLKLAQVGGSLEESLTISRSALQKVFVAVPAVEEALEPFVQTKPSYRFSAKKPGALEASDDGE